MTRTEGLPVEKGTYVLFFRMREPRILRVGRLGMLSFQRGFLAYVGSALGPGGLAARVGHHLRIASRPRWHLDYLRPFAEPNVLWYAESRKSLEHDWACILREAFVESIPTPGFGCSDCRCPSHLLHFPRVPALGDFVRRLPSGLRAGALPRGIPIPNEGKSP